LEISAKYYPFIKSRRAEHVARVEENINNYKVLVGKLEGKRLFGIPMHRGKKNRKLNLRKLDGKMWTGFIWLG
jgi:hypothetical protein